MLGVGWTEMLVIGVVALIVIGPKELPALMRRVGQFAGTIRRMGSDFQRELNKTTGLNEIANLRQSVTQPLKATADAIRKEFNTTTATGEVKPSGAIKPADPKVESVVDEIKAAAGIATPAAAAPVMTPIAQPADTPKAPVKAARPARIKAPAESKVATADIAPAKKAAPKAKKPIDSPAPVEAIAPAQATPAKRAAVKAAKPVTKAEGVVAKPAVKAVSAKPTAAKSTAAKPAAAKPATAEKPAAPKKAATTKKSAAAAKKP
ncbi:MULTISPECIES: Sec-independent protein translocase protein TatB [unclassified Devosia]|uniref:Sec-independent protein translocase protein TatB n=1 Tax=unclassified Devosia TaxID=196773 RepID=UPI00086BD83C|nr:MULTISPECIES: Sec-independent protein translocase protein TatB [unclassified Devosia]MBN9361193.1 twin-arginine translocase subunit TatB [Devosia sp.]ODS94535.1 MAG: twin arginine-targeting protein translocase TatB [Devosia sp. SCN 66-27]OJX26292.1 MAG: twin arginine-targeting protein translocase TatB [Devosia sp. 66-14]